METVQCGEALICKGSAVKHNNIDTRDVLLLRILFVITALLFNRLFLKAKPLSPSSATIFYADKMVPVCTLGSLCC